MLRFAMGFGTAVGLWVLWRAKKATDAGVPLVDAFSRPLDEVSAVARDYKAAGGEVIDLVR